jgi:probable F420-dependent oxidoreductase
MQFGFNLPISGPVLSPQHITQFAREGEALGYDYLTLTDHVLLPDLSAPGYPYTESGEFMSAAPTQRHEQLATAAYIAAKTSRIRIVLAVLVVPHRPAVLAAKSLATIDFLSGGRLTVGIGAGWLESESDAVVMTPFKERGVVTDEYVQAFRALWTEHKPVIDGRYVKVDGTMLMEPKPIQRPIPIWVGGESGPSMRRAARLGDAWYPIGTNRNALYDTLRRLAAGIARLRELTVKAGRAPDAVPVAYRVKRYGASVGAVASDGGRRLFSGSDTDIIADLRAFHELGIVAVDFDFEMSDMALSLREMRRFREQVLTRV